MKDIKEITDKLEQGVKNVFTSDNYAAYLAAMAKFYDYSANNCILIWLQCPQATLVASYKKWQDEFNRHVKKGEHGIRILAPMPHKYKQEVTLKDGTKDERDVEWLSFKPVPVFDISQTEGDELPTLAARLTGDVDQFNDLKQKLIDCAPVDVCFGEVPGEAYGFFSAEDRRIMVRNGLSQEQTIKTLVHEIAHSMLHDDGAEESDANRHTREVQAESVAYTVCSWLGIDTSDYSFGYVAGWSGGKEMKELTASMEVIRKTAKTIINSIEGR